MSTINCISTFHRLLHYYDDQMKDDEGGGASRTHGMDKKCVKCGQGTVAGFF